MKEMCHLLTAVLFSVLFVSCSDDIEVTRNPLSGTTWASSGYDEEDLMVARENSLSDGSCRLVIEFKEKQCFYYYQNILTRSHIPNGDKITSYQFNSYNRIMQYASRVFYLLSDTVFSDSRDGETATRKLRLQPDVSR